MGLYATTTSISVLLTNFLKYNSTTTDAYGTAVFSKSIARAEAVVNSALAAKYSMPFTTVPPFVTELSERLACYYSILTTDTQDGKQKNEFLDEFKTAFEDLKDLVNGKRKLTLTDGTLVPAITTSRFLSTTKDYETIFNLDAPKNWAINSSQLESIKNSRS